MVSEKEMWKKDDEEYRAQAELSVFILTLAIAGRLLPHHASRAIRYQFYSAESVASHRSGKRDKHIKLPKR